MKQLKLIESPEPEPAVNVSKVPKRSPFRYPGGKTWLVPAIRNWLGSRPSRPRLMVEPFAGGGIVGLTAAFERLVDHVILVELDPDVSAVWRTILGGEAEWLAERILGFELTQASIEPILSRRPENDKDHAFQTILRNRINHGGILAPGSGVLKNGENGRGIASRWYPTTLARRIREIAARRDRFTVFERDGAEVLREHASDPDVVFFIDPPYTAPGKRAGSRLYAFNQIDHQGLFEDCRSIRGDFLMTYDNAEAVRAMAGSNGFDVEPISMKNTHHAIMSELLIAPDLSWYRR
jgi:DNA adenine methylase